MEYVPENRTVSDYFKERSVNGALLLCADKAGEETARLERNENGDIDLVTRGTRYPVGDLGLLELYKAMCWVEGKVSAIH